MTHEELERIQDPRRARRIGAQVKEACDRRLKRRPNDIEVPIAPAHSVGRVFLHTFAVKLGKDIPSRIFQRAWSERAICDSPRSSTLAYELPTRKMLDPSVTPSARAFSDLEILRRLPAAQKSKDCEHL